MKLFNWFDKQANTGKSNETKSETYMDMIISLNKNYEIDFSIFLDDNITKLDVNENDYAIFCGAFLNAVLSNKMKKDSIEILTNQIKNNDNKKLITDIVSLITINQENNNKHNTFIKPSEVFAKYIV